MPKFGTNTLHDLLLETNQTVSDYGERAIWDVFEAALEAHNAQMEDVIGEFVQFTTNKLIGVGGQDSMTMGLLDEIGVPLAQKVGAGDNLGFPLNLRGRSLQWTWLNIRHRSVAYVAGQFNGLMTADRQTVTADIKRAIYTPTNNLTYVDVRSPERATLPLRALQNGDGFPIPVGPNGEGTTTWPPASHTHYTGDTSLTAANLSALILNVAEHYNSGDIRVVINQAQEAGVRGLAGFLAVTDPRIMIATTANQIPTSVASLDVMRRYDRMIGIYDGAEVWVKPWAVANYIVAYIRNSPSVNKILGFRYDPVVGRDLRILAEFEQYPLRASSYAREYGVSVWNRVGAAVLQINNAPYTAPTITPA
jgi:hypothetical protein